MVAFSDIIDFLLNLLTDETARAEFDQDPQGSLEQAGLEGVTAADIRDARLQLADSGAVSATDDGRGSSYPDGDDPVREIGYTTQHYVADEQVTYDDSGHADLSLVQGDTFVTIDDRDTLFFQSISDDDVTITQDNSVNNQLAIQDNDVTVSDDDTTINADDSFNSDDDLVAIQDNDVNGGDEVIDIDVTGGIASDAEAPPPVVETAVLEPGELDADPSADFGAVSGPAEVDEPVEEPVDDTAEDAVDDADAADLAADDSDALTV